MIALHPDGALAVRTGHVSNLTVIDCEGDGEPTGVEVLDAWESWVHVDWAPPNTLTALTPSGGVHRFYHFVTGSKSRNRVLPGIDVKSDGGYVAVPQGGSDRAWLNTLDVQPAGDELSAWLRSTRSFIGGGGGGGGGAPSGYDYERFVREGCPSGMRDYFFNEMTFRLRKAGATVEEMIARIRPVWERSAQPPNAEWYMPWEDVLYKVNRAMSDVTPDAPIPNWNVTAAITGEVIEVTNRPDVVNASDTGNSYRFIELHGENVRYVTEMKKWFLWDGTRWVMDKLNRVSFLTKDVADQVRRQADLSQDTDERRALGRHALTCEGNRSRKALLEIASQDDRIAVGLTDLNRNPMQFVVKNGVLDLNTGQLVPAQRFDLNTQCADVTYDPEAPCPRWREHIKFITGGDILLASYLRRAIGYTLTGLITEQVFFMLEGTGANGKNAFIEPIVALMGDYARTGTSALITGGDEQHPTILADLLGGRLVFIDEARQGRPLNVERVKQLTGSRKIKARRMQQDFFEFDAQLKLWIAGNNHPTMRDPSDGLWRRLHHVNFDAKVPEDKKIKDYGQLLFEEEASGILNWALDGLRDWLTISSLGQPESVTRSTLEIKDEEDLVAQWLEEKCQVTNSEIDRVTNAALYVDFSMWCTLSGVTLSDRPTRVQFGRALGGKKFDRWIAKVDGVTQRGFAGIRLRDGQ